jgi:hypothetical protein
VSTADSLLHTLDTSVCNVIWCLTCDYLKNGIFRMLCRASVASYS